MIHQVPKPVHRAEPLKLAGRALLKRDPAWPSPLEKIKHTANQLDPLHSRSHGKERKASTEQGGNAIEIRRIVQANKIPSTSNVDKIAVLAI